MTGHKARGSKNTTKVAEKETNFFQEKVHRVEARAKIEDNGLGRTEFQAEGMIAEENRPSGMAVSTLMALSGQKLGSLLGTTTRTCLWGSRWRCQQLSSWFPLHREGVGA